MNHLRIFIIAIVLFSHNLLAQSISKTELENYLIIQNSNEINSSVLGKGFHLIGDKNEYGHLTLYGKEGTMGAEAFAYGINDEIFSVIYMPAKQFYITYKEIIKKPDFVYSYSGNGNTYYENDYTRVGFNDEENIISLFVNKINNVELNITNTSNRIDFDTYKVKDMGYISIPNSLEIQKGLYKEYSDKIQTNNTCYKYEVLENRVIFQQNGVNEFKKTNTYARIIIKTRFYEPRTYENLSEPIYFPEDELNSLNTTLKNGIKSVFCDTQKILSWYGTEVIKVNEYYAIKISYLRQLDSNPPVYVEFYRFPNNDRLHEITLSYRLEDEELWKPLFGEALKSIIITKSY